MNTTQRNIICKVATIIECVFYLKTLAQLFIYKGVSCFFKDKNFRVLILHLKIHLEILPNDKILQKSVENVKQI